LKEGKITAPKIAIGCEEPIGGGTVYKKLLAHAAVRVGGVDNLAARLGISSRVVSRYLTGKENIPESLFLVLVDLILEARERF